MTADGTNAKMSSWFEHFHLSSDPFNEDSVAWNFFYGGRYGVASLQLEQALERKSGLIVVTGPPGSGKSTLVRNSLGRQRMCACATVSAAQTSPSAVIDVLLRSREPIESVFSATRKRAALISMIEQARASGRPIVCVIEDAHLARAGQIKDLVHAIDTAPNGARVFRVVLVGRPPLLSTLRSRALGDLKARTTVMIETVPLSSTEISEFLYERLEAAEALLPDVLLPSLTISAIAHQSGGIIGRAAVLARSALERAAETGADCVSVELVEEVASLYGHPDASNARPKHRTARAFALGATAALVSLALVVAAAQVQLLGSGGRRIRANLEALRALAGLTGTVTEGAASGEAPGFEKAQIEEAGAGMTLSQLGTPREEFLRGSRAPGAKGGAAGTQAPKAGTTTGARGTSSQGYDVQIKPPARPGTLSAGAEPAGGAGHGETTTITVPGIPGPLEPKDSGSRRVIRSSDYAAPLTPPVETTGTGDAGSQPSRGLSGHVPLPDEPAADGVGAAPRHGVPMTPPATDTATARNAPRQEAILSPQVALQVGAFRDRNSADALRDTLARDFKDVYVSKIDSGGEPLYRVRIGKLKGQADVARTKERLQAAGYASFRVTEP